MGNSTGSGLCIDLNVVAVTRLASGGRPAILLAAVAPDSGFQISCPRRTWNQRSSRRRLQRHEGLRPELVSSLHQELSPSGVQGQVVLPSGATRTAIWARAGIYVASWPASMSTAAARKWRDVAFVVSTVANW